MAHAAAAAMRDEPVNAPRKAKQERRARTLEEALDLKLAVAQRYRGTIRFYESHRSLLTSAEHRDTATSSLQKAERRLEELTRTVAALRRALRQQETRRQAAMPPKAAICDVFGRYCEDAISVAWCESRLRTTAQNGEYLGLFQMGSYARRLFGHGSSAREQAAAAHKYFIRSGRDWSPWSCRWAAR